MLVSERLMFLAKYAEFLKIRGMIQSSNNDSNPDTEAGDIDRIAQATDLLLFLINSEWSPNFFVTRLLEDAAQLLTDDRLPPQNVAYLQRLMGCLQVPVMALLICNHSFLGGRIPKIPCLVRFAERHQESTE